MTMKNYFRSTLTGAVISMTLFAPLPAMAGGGIELGVLTCKSIPGTHSYYVIHHSVGVDCIFNHNHGQESYKGRAGIGFGLDLNWRQTENMAFLVIGGTSDVDPSAHSLTGRYVGAQASATLAVGANVAVLVGGGHKNVSLQPIALGVNTGLGAALGIGYISLDPSIDS
ncbi:MAG: DUF992 domain-containing protein [Candidatus Thiodiazotropha sp. (ex Codakia rugifera)]|nr:DUF992 domain-containing protein [Candidatus Thiodiazotropha sp. (ex Codakia rugifera)]